MGEKKKIKKDHLVWLFNFVSLYMPRRSCNTEAPFRSGARAAGGLFDDSGSCSCGSMTWTIFFRYTLCRVCPFLFRLAGYDVGWRALSRHGINYCINYLWCYTLKHTMAPGCHISWWRLPSWLGTQESEGKKSKPRGLKGEATETMGLWLLTSVAWVTQSRALTWTFQLSPGLPLLYFSFSHPSTFSSEGRSRKHSPVLTHYYQLCVRGPHPLWQQHLSTKSLFALQVFGDCKLHPSCNTMACN